MLTTGGRTVPRAEKDCTPVQAPADIRIGIDKANDLIFKNLEEQLEEVVPWALTTISGCWWGSGSAGP